jgi:hypothetical protein
MDRLVARRPRNAYEVQWRAVPLASVSGLQLDGPARLKSRFGALEKWDRRLMSR